MRSPPRALWGGLTAVLVSMVASTAAGEAEPTISDVTIECDLPRCEDATERERLFRLAGLEVGKRYVHADGERAVWFLEQTELFEAGSIELFERPGGDDTVGLTLRTRGRTYIQDVSIDVGLSLQEEVEQRLFMRSGRAYDPADVARQVESIDAIFEQEGYYGTRVQIIAEPVEPYLVDLEVIVDKGERLDVRDIYIRGHTALDYDEIRQLLLSEFGFFRTYNAAAFDSGVETLLERYREADYLRARVVEQEAVPDLRARVVDLYLEIEEGPRWSFELIGNRQLSDAEIIDVLPFFRIGYIDEAEIQRSVGEIEALYRTGGFYFVSVRAHQERVGEGRYVVTYTIFEGELAAVRSIDFDGNFTATDDELTALIGTRVVSTLDASGFLQPGQLEADARAMEAYYREIGHLSAHVPRWTVVADDEGRSLYVTFFIVEGPRTEVTGVRFRGNEIFSAAQLSARLRLREGAVLGPASLASDVAAIRSRYLGRGHRLLKLDVVCYVGEEWHRCEAPRFPPACLGFQPERCTERRRGDLLVQECGRIAEDTTCELSGGVQDDEVVVEYRFAESELVTMGEVFVVGNFRTNDDVIRSELRMSRGDPFNPALLIESQANLRALRLFNSVSVRTIGIGDQSPYQTDRASVVVSVEESSSQAIELRLGLVSENRVDDEFRVNLETFVGFVDRNLFGRALILQLLSSFKNDIVGAAQISNGEFIATLAGILTDPRFDWFNAADDPWELQSVIAYRYDKLTSVLHEIRFEGAIQARQSFAAVEGLFFSIGAGVTRVETKLPEARDFDPPRWILRLEPALILDRRNNPLNPTQGYRAELALEFADRFFGPGVQTEQFTKISLSASHHVPLATHFVLAFHLRFGFALGGIFSGFARADELEDGMVLPPSERFRLGGISGVRGFPDNGLGPANDIGQPIGGDVVLTGTTELRFPLLPSIDLFGAWFLDGGQQQRSFAEMTAEGFRFSTGLGIRLLAFGLVPVVLDYGLVLDRRFGETLGKLQFNVGYTF